MPVVSVYPLELRAVRSSNLAAQAALGVFKEVRGAPPWLSRTERHLTLTHRLALQQTNWLRLCTVDIRVKLLSYWILHAFMHKVVFKGAAAHSATLKLSHVHARTCALFA